jgi:membrane peptidoglycan carboxypeptidase
MLGLGFITQDEFRRAKEEKVRFEPRGLGSIKAPHFSLYIKEYLVEKYGEDVVEKGGLKVKTTLNWQFQQKAEEILKKFAEENEKKFNAFNAGLVMMDPKLGEILAMVGSRDYFEEPRPQGCAPGINCRFDPKVNITLRSRQPGSAFKPFVYATLFKKGFTPEAVLFDLPTEFNPLCSSEGKAPEGLDEDKCYHPQNYDEKFRGPVSLREALAQSINLPSVKVLYLAGLLDSLKLARDMGITTLNEPERYGLTLVLGGGEVKLLELTGAYSVFATGGILNQPTGILKVEDGSGKILQEYRPKNFQVLDSNIANIISDILTDNKARAPAFGESSFLYFPERPVAVKTGTTNDYRDAWVVGYAPNLALGVWVGNNDNTPMEKKVAGFIAAPLWNAVLKEIFKELPREEFNLPLTQNVSKPILKGEWRGGMVYKIDKISKKLATEFTPEELIEERVIREVHSILYWLDKNNPEGPRPENPQNDGQFNNWEMVVRRWAGAQNLLDEDEGVIPKEFDDLHRPEYTPKATFIINPEGESFRPHTNLRVLFLVESKITLEQADLFLGSEYIGSSKIYPFEFSITLPDLEMEEITISANIYDIVRNKTNLSKTIRISDL